MQYLPVKPASSDTWQKAIWEDDIPDQSVSLHNGNVASMSDLEREREILCRSGERCVSNAGGLLIISNPSIIPSDHCGKTTPRWERNTWVLDLSWGLCQPRELILTAEIFAERMDKQWVMVRALSGYYWCQLYDGVIVVVITMLGPR